jgi:hypothetical protein
VLSGYLGIRWEQKKEIIMHKPCIKSVTRWAVLAVAAMAIAGGNIDAAEKPILVADYVGRGWTNELVRFAFEAGKKECVAESVRMKGPKGPVAAQLLDVECWPDTKFVRKAKLAFVVDQLAPLEKATYTVSYSDRPVSEPAPATDLKVIRTDKAIELTTAAFGVRIPVDGLPGPISGLRFGDGAWMGASRLFGKEGAKNPSVRVLDEGPVVGRVEVAYVFADDSCMTVRVAVAAGDAAARVEMPCSKDSPECGWELALDNAISTNGIALVVGRSPYARTVRTPTPATPTNPVCYLHCWQACGWFPDSGSQISFGLTGKPVDIRFCANDAAAWVPGSEPQTYYPGVKSWNLDMITTMWSGWQNRRIPFFRTDKGGVALRVSVLSGCRTWTVGEGAPRIGRRLDVVKDYVLDWPTASKEKHPHLVVDRVDVEAALKREGIHSPVIKEYLGSSYFPQSGGAYLVSGDSKEIETRLQSARQLKENLAKLGDIDVMRHTVPLAFIYDAIADTGLLTPAERALCRAQLAYLAYYVADPETWDPTRGYCSGNPNMTCSYVIGPALIGCLFPDHPMAAQWIGNAEQWMQRWLDEEVSEEGEWMCEGMHYGQVSLSPMTSFAVAARKAGYHDFFADPKFKKLALYFAKQYTPKDPRLKDVRNPPTVGRGLSDIWSHSGVFAKALVKSDPELSKALQWAWQQEGGRYYLEYYMSGHDYLYCDPTLPAQNPNWGSELFPHLGVIFRNGVGTPHENYVNYLTAVNALGNLDVWTPNVGGLACWFAKGKPVSSAFNFETGYKEQHELSRDGVMLARNYAPGDKGAPFGYYVSTTFEGFAALASADYCRSTFAITKPDDRDWMSPTPLPAWPKVKAATEPKLQWTRQILFLRDPDPAGANYLVLRDSTSGGQPTMWQFRTYSEKIGTPDQTTDLTRFLADKPGTNSVAARLLPGGDRYTAIGQFGVDVEFFVAIPADTPRNTMRWGALSFHVGSQFMDFLHLQQPGDGAYFVAVFPRQRAEEAPAFAQLADGRVIKVAGAFGVDYAFLSRDTAEAKADDASFKGTAATVQDRASGLALALAAGGSVAYKSYGLTAPMAASLRAEKDGVALQFPAGHSGGEVTIMAPAGLSLDARASGGIQRTEGKDGQYILSVSVGATSARLIR